jgi:protein-S-isoprenylcysteine O-methyltransferase Ste14
MNPLTLSRILCCGLFILFMAIRIIFTIITKRKESKESNKKVNARQENRLNFILRRFIIIPLVIIFSILFSLKPAWVTYFTFHLPLVFILIIGTVGFISELLLIWIHVSLGREWYASLTLREGHRLIRTGPYSKVRHPMYTALIIIYSSLALLSANIIISILILIAIISLVIRVPEEEKMMTEEFGNEYSDYMSKTGRFFPNLY